MKGLINTSISAWVFNTGNSSSYSDCISSITCGNVQYFPSSYFRKNQITEVTKLIGDSTKKSPCLSIHSLFNPKRIVLADSVASVISCIEEGSKGLQRCDTERLSKLITKNEGIKAYLFLCCRSQL